MSAGDETTHPSFSDCGIKLLPVKSLENLGSTDVGPIGWTLRVQLRHNQILKRCGKALHRFGRQRNRHQPVLEVVWEVVNVRPDTSVEIEALHKWQQLSIEVERVNVIGWAGEHTKESHCAPANDDHPEARPWVVQGYRAIELS